MLNLGRADSQHMAPGSWGITIPFVLFNSLPNLSNYEFIEAMEDYWLPVLFMGVGYSSGPVTFGIRYDVLYNENKSIYANPWMPFIRVFF